MTELELRMFNVTLNIDSVLILADVSKSVWNRKNKKK
jgi:hypothetical protein